MRAGRRLLTISFLMAIFVVPAHAAIVGTVINIDGKAIGGAKVSMFAPETVAARRTRLTSTTPQRTPLAVVSTDSNGRFTLDPPKDQSVVDIRFEAAGYGLASTRMTNDDDAGAVLLTQAATKRGTITANGKPVANATVVWLGGAEYTTTTDADGHYSVADPTKWAQRVMVIHPDYATYDEGGLNAPKGVDFTLTAGVAVKGRVVAEDGQTAVGDSMLLVDGWPAGKSAADGTFTIAHAPKSWQQVETRSSSRVAMRARAGEAAVTLKLSRIATISGSVHDAKSQLPLSWANVGLMPAGTGRFGTNPTADVYTDAKGNYTISVVAGSYDVRTSHPGYTSPAVAVAVKTGQNATKPLYAMQQGRISGTVADEDKRPIGAARLTVHQAVRGGGMMMFMGGGGMMGQSTAWSAPDGRFVAHNVEPDNDVQIDAVKRGFPAAKSSTMKVAGGERKSGVTITIPRGVAFSGRVLDKDGKALSGVAIEAVEASQDATGMGMRRVVMSAMRGNREDDAVRSGSDGTFTMQLKPSTYDVVFKREGFSTKSLRAQKVDATAKPVEVRLDPGVEITGRVTRSGAGVEGVNVTAVSQDGMANAVTAADGTFRLGDLTPGQMMLSVNKQDAFIQDIRPVTAPARDVAIELPSGGRIVGRVVDKGSHAPVTAFQAGVTTSRGGGGMVVMMPPMLRQFTSDDGSFVLENVRPGPTQVVVNAPGYTTTRMPNIEVEDGKTVADVEVALETGAKLTGRVTGPDGGALSGVTVRSDPTAGGGGRVMRFDAAESTAITDPNGEYSLDSLEPGDKSFVFSRSGYLSETRSVTISGKDARLDVQLTTGVRVSGMVLTDGGAPIGDALVRANSASEMDGGREARTDANGSFQIEGLAPGHYGFTASKAGYANGTLRDVDIAALAPVRITLKSGGIITGQVTGLTQQELDATTVTASSASGSATAPVDSAGNFRIEGAPIGTVRVGARTGQMFGGSAKSAPPKTVELDAGGTAQVSIEFKSGTVIRGRITRNGQVLGSATIVFFPRNGKTQTNASATADANGQYELNGLDDGPYSVQVVDFQRMTPFTTTYEVQGSGNFDIDFKVSSLHGQVVDAADGHALVDAHIDLRPKSASGFLGSRSVTTDGSGGFVLDSISAGTYQISADKDGYGHDVRDITIGDSAPDDVQFKLSPSDGVLLRVVDGRDGQLLSAMVHVVDNQGHEIDTPFRFGGGGAEPIKLQLAPGQYRATVSAMSYAPVTVTLTSPSQQTVSLLPGGTLIVHSSSSTPLRGRLIDANGMSYSRNPFSGDGIFAINPSPGATTLNNIAVGHYRLEVLDGSDRIVKTVDVDVIAGQPVNYDV